FGDDDFNKDDDNYGKTNNDDDDDSATKNARLHKDNKSLWDKIRAKHVGREFCQIPAPAAGIRRISTIPAPAPAPAAGMPVYRR
ncbi:hypothetical protein FRC06_009909, partial [Ceratobasidium sp. 370]